jgi:hypothetical protein
VFYVADVALVFDTYELLSNTLASRTRPLTETEAKLLRTVFGNSLTYELIRMDERAHLGPRRYKFCYVSFYTINSWGPISPVTLVHEAVHLWQYRRVGAVYIPRALRAQRSEMGYNYGGAEKLASYPDLDFYNYEQQADIIADAYALKTAAPLRWSKLGRQDEALFLPFLRQLRNEIKPS